MTTLAAPTPIATFPVTPAPLADLLPGDIYQARKIAQTLDADSINLMCDRLSQPADTAENARLDGLVLARYRHAAYLLTGPMHGPDRPAAAPWALAMADHVIARDTDGDPYIETPISRATQLGTGEVHLDVEPNLSELEFVEFVAALQSFLDTTVDPNGTLRETARLARIARRQAVA